MVNIITFLYYVVIVFFFSPLQFYVLYISQFQTEDDSWAVETCRLVSKQTSFFQIIVKVFQY